MSAGLAAAESVSGKAGPARAVCISDDLAHFQVIALYLLRPHRTVKYAGCSESAFGRAGPARAVFISDDFAHFQIIAPYLLMPLRIADRYMWAAVRVPVWAFIMEVAGELADSAGPSCEELVWTDVLCTVPSSSSCILPARAAP